MMRPIRSGELRHRGTFQVEREIEDGHGGQKLEWTDVYVNVPVSIEPISGTEAVVARQLQDSVTHKVRLRYVPGIVAKMRLVARTAAAASAPLREFNIREVRNLDERSRVLELRCEEGVAT